MWRVNHDDRTVLVGRHFSSQERATLNAPLLDRVFRENPDVEVIIHLHRYLKNEPTLKYTVPGTVDESDLALGGQRVFNIQGHGSVVSFTTSDVDVIAKWAYNPEIWVP